MKRKQNYTYLLRLFLLLLLILLLAFLITVAVYSQWSVLYKLGAVIIAIPSVSRCVKIVKSLYYE